MFPLKMVIFHSYVKLPEGIPIFRNTRYDIPSDFFWGFFFGHRPVWGCPKIEDTVGIHSSRSELRIKGDNENHGLAIYLIPKLRTGGVGGFPQIDLCTVLVYFLWWTLFHHMLLYGVSFMCASFVNVVLKKQTEQVQYIIVTKWWIKCIMPIITQIKGWLNVIIQL